MVWGICAPRLYLLQGTLEWSYMHWIWSAVKNGPVPLQLWEAIEMTQKGWLGSCHILPRYIYSDFNSKQQDTLRFGESVTLGYTLQGTLEGSYVGRAQAFINIHWVVSGMIEYVTWPCPPFCVISMASRSLSGAGLLFAVELVNIILYSSSLETSPLCDEEGVWATVC